MDTIQLELELLDLQALYERTKNDATRAELADKIVLKKKEIKAANEVIAEKSVKVQKEAPSRLDHTDSGIVKSSFNLGGNTFSVMI